MVRVVPGALLGVREDLVGGLDLGEALRGPLDVAVVPVRVQLEGFLPVGFLDPMAGRQTVLGWLALEGGCPYVDT